MKKKYYIVIGLIFLISFRFYSSLFYPILNSDNAVTILMIYYFKLPHDLYFWGQDRMGSIIPLIGQVFFKIFNLSAVTSEAFTHYLILLLGFLAFSNFLKSYFLKIAFALIWFFPPFRLIDVTQQYTGVEYSLIAISCWLIAYYQNKSIHNNLLLKHIVLSLITLLLIASIWVSDMAMVTVFLLLIVQLYFYFRKNKLSFSFFKKIEFHYSIIGLIMGYFFIHYAKSVSINRQDYTTFSDFNTIKQSCSIFYNSIKDLLSFKSNEPFTSVYSFLILIIIVIIIFHLKKLKLNDISKKWILFFLFDATFLFIIIITSKWTFLNGVPRRYFTCTYISLSFALLLILDNIDIKSKNVGIIKWILIITVLIGGVGTTFNIRYIWPKTLTPAIKVVGEFQILGKIGIIADYWNSYIVSCTNPDLIKATPHDKTWSVRNYSFVDEVFKQKNIYVIRDMWLDSFPDTLSQFNRILVKDGIEFRIGNCNVCKYVVTNNPK